VADKNRTLVDRVWDFLASVKLAVINFTAISATSIVGTLIEQGAPRQQNLELLAKFVGDSMAPRAYDIFYALGFMDMYRSWWFIGLLMLFAVNIIICSIDRIPRAWRAATENMKPLKDEQFSSFPVRSQVIMDGAPGDNRERIIAAIKAAGFSKPGETGVEDGYQLLSSKQGFARLGVYITHLSILVILIGAVVGIMFGFKGSVTLFEGEATAAAYKKYGYAKTGEQQEVANALLSSGGNVSQAVDQLAAKYQRTPESILRRIREIGMDPLGFVLKCDDSGVDFYPQSFTPKEYWSDLSVRDGSGNVVERKRIEVNGPLKRGGFTFYQSSHGVQARTLRQDTKGTAYFGPYDPMDYQDFIFEVVQRGGGAPKTVKAKFEQPFQIPGTGATATVKSFIPTWGGDQRQQSSLSNLVVELEVSDPDLGVYKYMVPQRARQEPMRDGTRLTIKDIWGIEYTGLQVRRDPGVWIVYLGCAIMAIGLYMAFFMSHRRLWVQATASGGKTTLRAAGTAHKHRESFEHKVEKAIGLLSEGGN
jgi:cytochrome c biogenesis protein